MKFTVAASLLDACVLGGLATAPTYGYDLTQRLQSIIDVSESTLYPVLRRLLKDGLLTSFDMPYDGRNRRYYQITEEGKNALAAYIEAWDAYKESIETLLMGGSKDEQA